MRPSEYICTQDINKTIQLMQGQLRSLINVKLFFYRTDMNSVETECI